MSNNAVEVIELDKEDHTKELILVWFGLVILTLLSWWFRDHGLEGVAAFSAILCLAFVKVYMIGFSFMELKIAPRTYKTIFTVWCFFSCFSLIAMVAVTSWAPSLLPAMMEAVMFSLE